MPNSPSLLYTFANHMHWVDMQWLWGYSVLPGSVRDMIRLCREAGVKGNVNFDAVGYEKMAAECPDALAELRDAVAEGIIEPVGCSYGQPYGLFHGGESNVRQLTYGVRTTRRLLGVRPRAFWEEEFYFFPQLPQMLAQCGYTGACLFFQWTWHTPELPKEPHALILWEGIDGTRLPTLPRNDLNVHQWPEDFDGLLDSGLIKELPTPVIAQWLELMPSKDWMCRSELLLPRLKELVSDPRFKVTPGTLSEVIQSLQSPERQRGDHAPGESPRPAPIRRYSIDDVWHGMTLGKNADRHPRASRQIESETLHAESLSALTGLFGRPYPSWDLYPTWELEEAWRETLAAQHHDNHECEGLCGFVADGQFRRARHLINEVHGRAHRQLTDRVGEPLALNPLGFERTCTAWPEGESQPVTVTIPPFGYAPSSLAVRTGRAPTVSREGSIVRLARDGLSVVVDVEAGVIRQITTPAHPAGVLAAEVPLGALRRVVNGRESSVPPITQVDTDEAGVTLWLQHEPANDHVPASDTPATGLAIGISLAPDSAAVDLKFFDFEALARPDPGFAGALRMPIVPRWEIAEIRTDTPFAAGAVRGGPPGRRKYPRGDWMTSPQWFEDVSGSITSHRFVDLLHADGSGLLVLHDGSQQFFRTPCGVDCILCAYDPWDERRYEPGLLSSATFRLFPHTGMRDSQRIRAALEFIAPQQQLDRFPHPSPVGGGAPEPGTAPPRFGPLELCNAPGVLAHALFRESIKSGEHLPNWAGHRMFAASDGACDHPYVIRLVEWDNQPAEVVLKLAGPVAMAAKTNLLGEVLEAGTPSPPQSGFSAADTRWLTPETADPPAWAAGATLRGQPMTWSQVRFTMRPREIATIYADLVVGRKEWRDLDAKREVWAKVHKTH